MGSKQPANQYTVRGVPDRVDEALRRRARDEGKSLNQVTVEALAAAAGVAEREVRYHDLDSLAGAWQEDPEFDAALEEQDQIEPELWK
jgi:hypothetical protein